jgi:arsenate reductase
MGGDRVEAYSACLTPTGEVAGAAVAALERLGYSASGLSSKGLTEVPLQEMDVIVSLAGRQGLPLLPRHLPAHLEAWDIPDPCGEDDQVFRATARLLERRVAKLLPTLLGGGRES